MQDQIKESFKKVKEDIYSLKEQLDFLNLEIQEIKRTLNQTLKTFQQTDRHIIPTDTPTHTSPLQSSKPQNLEVSIGNEGVPTDRQTDQQTDRHISKFAQLVSSRGERFPSEEYHSETRTPITREKRDVNAPEKKQDKLSHIETVSQVLDSLDNLKKDLRSKFKKLTPQEIYIFSLIYQLEDQGNIVDYTLLSEKTKLSQSSIRDYILKLIKKGVPVDKTKENNKQVILSISKDFKKIASLNTILSLREL